MCASRAIVAWAAVWSPLLMAFLGTLCGAAMIGPAAGVFRSHGIFSACSRRSCFTLAPHLRFPVAGVDGVLFWTYHPVARPSGRGRWTGAVWPFLLTDTGTSARPSPEALENIDNKPGRRRESTGASRISRPALRSFSQVTPVFRARFCIIFESIHPLSHSHRGAIVGGGIGAVLLTQAISTQKDWEEVSYYIIPDHPVLVMAMGHAVGAGLEIPV